MKGKIKVICDSPLCIKLDIKTDEFDCGIGIDIDSAVALTEDLQKAVSHSMRLLIKQSMIERAKEKRGKYEKSI